MAIRLVDLDESPESVVLPSGRTVPVRLVDAGTFQLARELQEDPTQVGLIMPVLQRVLPDATVEEIQSLTPPMISAVVAIASGRVDEVYKLLGESSGAAPVPAMPDSLPVTPSGTSLGA